MEQIKKYMNPKWWLIVPVEQFAPLFVVLLGLVASGYLHREGGEGVSE
ncbi:MAG: hypothetical protein HOI28_06275 [Euryarchaeota archaeon]|jgi:hypothetical protein|nr:hypothetical protein [Euryarchaeota archaeon]MBT5736428.1 hypothetical protein [Euryarchaeota archaeon]